MDESEVFAVVEGRGRTSVTAAAKDAPAHTHDNIPGHKALAIFHPPFLVGVPVTKGSPRLVFEPQAHRFCIFIA